MSEIKRYGMDRRGGSLTSPKPVLWGITEKEGGPYVLFVDHEAEVAGLRALVARQADGLREMEWGYHLYDRMTCPICDALRDDSKHESDCWLAQLLTDSAMATALSWHEQEKRRAVREALESARRRVADIRATGGQLADTYERTRTEALGSAEEAIDDQIAALDAPKEEAPS